MPISPLSCNLGNRAFVRPSGDSQARLFEQSEPDQAFNHSRTENMQPLSLVRRFTPVRHLMLPELRVVLARPNATSPITQDVRSSANRPMLRRAPPLTAASPRGEENSASIPPHSCRIPLTSPPPLSTITVKRAIHAGDRRTAPMAFLKRRLWSTWIADVCRLRCLSQQTGTCDLINFLAGVMVLDILCSFTEPSSSIGYGLAGVGTAPRRNEPVDNESEKRQNGQCNCRLK